jgi:hypothetical protein
MSSEVARLRKGWRDGLSNPLYSGSVGFCCPQNMAEIKLLTVAAPLLCHAAQANRVVRLLEGRRSWSIERPLVVLAVHNDAEEAPTERFQAGAAGDLARYVIVRQKGHNDTVSNAIELFRQQFDPAADSFTAKTGSL